MHSKLTDISAEQAASARNGFEEWLLKVKGFLSRTLHDKYEFTKLTRHAVHFKYDRKIDVDLPLSPYWSSRDELYRFLMRLHQSERFEYVSHILTTITMNARGSD